MPIYKKKNKEIEEIRKEQKRLKKQIEKLQAKYDDNAEILKWYKEI